MKTVILCGGKGTRMREETEYKPKPMVEIGGIPMLIHIMNTYSYHGFNDFILCLGYKANMIKEYFLNLETFSNDFTLSFSRGKSKITLHSPTTKDWNITFADTGEDTPTGGRIKNIERYIADDNFFLTYGDGLANINIPELLSYHTSHNRICTLTGTKRKSRYGVLSVNSSGIANSFSEKPHPDGLINGGFYVFNKNIFEILTNESILEEETLPHLARISQLAVYPHKGYWTAIDTYKEVEQINALYNLNERPWISP